MSAIDKKEAKISDCGKYRYSLYRGWDDLKPLCTFIMLNPSTADAENDDPTIRRCINYAKDWGYGGLLVLNLFAYRATDPQELKEVDDPIGPGNDKHIKDEVWATIHFGGIVVCAWGTHGALNQRGAFIEQMFKGMGVRPFCLKETKSGFPSHPLYLAKSLQPFELHKKSMYKLKVGKEGIIKAAAEEDL